MPEKSAQVLGAQYRMVTCLKNGNRDLAKWWMRVAADARRCDVQDAQRLEPEMPEGRWWR